MKKTLSNIADELGIKKYIVYRAYKRYIEPQRNSTGIERNETKIKLDESEVIILKAKIIENDIQQNAKKDENETQHNVNDVQQLLQTLNSTIEMLKTELEATRMEINVKNRQIENLIELQRNSQILLHNNNKDVHQLPDPETSEKKENFWKKLFK